MLGALLVASLGEYRYRSLLQLGALAAYGVTLALFAASRRLEFSLALLFVASAVSMIASSLNQTFLQSLAPDAMCGRVLGVLTLTTFGLMPLGRLLAGAAAQRWGVPIVVGIAGVLTALFALSILLTRPPERNLP